MVIEVKMYTVICDSCGKDVNENSEYSAWNDKEYAQEIAIEYWWLKENNKHYCNDCYYYDNNDKLVIAKKQ